MPSGSSGHAVEFPEHAALKSVSELRALLDGQPSGMVALDTHEHVLFANSAAARLLGREPTRGTTLDTLLRDACGVDETVDLRDALAHGTQLQAGSRWLQIQQSALPAGGEIASSLTIVDVTSLCRALDEQTESLRFVSHDLRSPQNSIVALTDLYESDRAAFDACGGLARIAELARHALSLGDQFIFSSVAEGVHQRDFVRFELRSTMLSTARQLDVAARYRDVTLHSWAPQGAAIWVQGVRTFVARALQNLIDNAVRASPAGARVTVSLELDREFAVVTIADQAGGLPGLAPRDTVDQFDAFARRASGGFGIGLQLAARIVRLHGGTLHAMRNAEDGTDFVMRLPCLNRGRTGVAASAPLASFAAPGPFATPPEAGPPHETLSSCRSS